MKSQLPDYYGILEIPETASQADVREAYKKQALLHHPDRLSDNTSAEEREEATRRFQIIADAYYILGDTHRRQTYDQTRRKQQKATPMSEAMPGNTPNDANRMFGNVFEELLRPEVEHVKPIWQCLGAGAGALLGFIFANVPGAAVGAFAGKTLGSIRDRKGVSVYTAFQRLSANERRDILSALLTRFFMQGAAGVMK